MRLTDQTPFLCLSPYSHLTPPLFRVMFAASTSSSPFSELFYLKLYVVAEGTLGSLIEGIHFILSFLNFFSAFCFVAPLPWSPV